MRTLGTAIKAEAENAATDPGHAELLHLMGDAHIAAAAQIEADASATVHALDALANIRAMIGNVDHTKGNGPNSAEYRGGLLNDIRDIVTRALRP